jgi:hypothetical protein
MAAMPPPIADERNGLKEYLAAQQYAFHTVSFGLTDEQARATPTVNSPKPTNGRRKGPFLRPFVGLGACGDRFGRMW